MECKYKLYKADIPVVLYKEKVMMINHLKYIDRTDLKYTFLNTLFPIG